MNNNNNNMLHCLNTSGNLTGNCSDMTVLERQRPRMKWQQEQQEQHQNQGFYCGTGFHAAVSSLQVHNSQEMMMIEGGDSAVAEMLAQSMKSDPGLENGWPELGKYEMPSMGFGSSGFDVNSVISRTSNCPNTVPATAVADAKVRVSVSGKEKMSSASGKESFKKRKADKVQNSKVVVAENDNKDKRIKVRAEEGESKATEQNSTKNTTATTNNNNGETSAGTSKENSKVSEVQKPDYIHVRARRGQATDSHSLAERVRREKISERMKYLQDLVPGCNKITGKAGMLDEIINYVQSLQRQVEFLSMKLATVNPRLDFNVDDLFTKEMFAAFAPSFPTSGIPPDMNIPGYLQFNCGIDMGINPPDMGLRRSISAPVSMPETFLDSCCFNQQILPSCTWESDLHNLSNVAFDEARITSFASQPFTGLVEGSNLKMEM